MRGFYIKVKLNKTGAGGKQVSILDKEIDDFSCAQADESGVFVFSQTGVCASVNADFILQGYLNPGSEKYVPDRKIEGSFVIVDTERGKIIAGRDRRQVYHLYFAIKEDFFVVTTEERWLIERADFREIDAVVLDMFLGETLLPPFPVLKNTSLLLPGTYLEFDIQRESVDIKQFWKINKVNVPASYVEAMEKYAALLLQEIGHNLTPVTSGLFLSGGSDSALVVAAICHLYKDHPEKVKALHMLLKDDLSIEHKDVKNLSGRYNFDLSYLYPLKNTEEWKQVVKNSLQECSFGSIYESVPNIFRAVEKLAEVLEPGSTIFNGEMCLLDVGFTESSDKTRKLRRWFYIGPGRFLAKHIKIIPGFMKINWNKHVLLPWEPKPFYHKWLILLSMLYAWGRKEYYYSGLKVGWSGFPGVWLQRSFLPKNVSGSSEKKITREFTNFYVDKIDCCTVSNMTVGWYSEANNVTMQQEAASNNGFSMCFSFSSAELMDYAASLPAKWCEDKKIQKDVCRKIFDMPEETAYRLKFHGEKFDSFQILYGEFMNEMLEEISMADFGVLTENIRLAIKKNALNRYQLITLYGFAIKIKFSHLKVVV